MKTTCILALIFLFLSYPNLQVSAQDDCSLVLERAEKLFDEGIIEKIPELLANCLSNGFNRQEKIRAHRLLVLTHLFDNNYPEAESAMSAFLKDIPEYQIQPGDPAEFTSLFSLFRSFPFLSIGPFAGVNMSSATLIEPYGPYNTNLNEGQFSITSPEFQIGAGINIFLSDRFELNLESIYTRTSFSYSNLQYGFALIESKETRQTLEFPVSLTFDLSEGRWRPYLRIGASYGFMINSESSYKRSYTNNNTEPGSQVETTGVDVSDNRSRGSYNAVLGSGLKYRIPRGYLVFDLRYFYGLSNLVNSENRWNQESVFSFYHADGDFLVDYFAFSVGLRFSFYKTKKL